MELRDQLDRDGYAVLPSVLEEEELAPVERDLRPLGKSARNVLQLASVQELARSPKLRQVVESVLGPGAFAVRGQWFYKMADANWYVTWHQDRVIAVKEKRQVPGYTAWTEKEGVPHVTPPAALLEQMLALRVHLDDSTPANGPFKVIPGSHRKGVIPAADFSMAIVAEQPVALTAPRGSVVALRPLIVHASPAAESGERGVLHLEYAAEELPRGLEWHERVA